MGAGARPADRSAPRLVGIDAARGLAMLLVALSHFASFSAGPVSASLALMPRLAMMASPTFVLISGTMLGFLFGTMGTQFARARIKLVDRGLFLLIVGHPLLMLAYLSPERGWDEAYARTFITDAIGVAVASGALLVAVVPRVWRAGIAAALFAGSWAAILLLPPLDGAPRLAQDLLLGMPREAVLHNSFPLLPWLAVYVAGTALGERLAVAVREAGGDADFARICARAGAAALALALLGKLLWYLVRPDEIVGHWWSLYHLLSPFAKRPPSLVYLLAYGGGGLLLIAGVFALARRERARRVVAALGVLGRASLFAFLFQAFLYRTLLHRIELPFRGWWPVHFALSAAVLWAAAWAWLRADGNRLLTVGVPRLADAFRRRRRARAIVAALAPSEGV